MSDFTEPDVPLEQFEPAPKEDRILLGLRRSSWEQIFETLKWRGLRPMSEQDAESYLKATGEHYSDGNFWAAIQSLQAQLRR